MSVKTVKLSPANAAAPRKPARDRVIIEAEKAYRASAQYEYDKLCKKLSLYRRRETLARNGIEETQEAIRNLLLTLARKDMPMPLPTEEAS